jgi:hypothetical protein
MRTRPPVIGCLLLSAFCLSLIAFAQTNWQRTYGGPRPEQGYCVQQTSDGGFIIAGSTESFGAGEPDVYLIRTDAQGDTLWTRTYGGPLEDEGYSVQQTADGGYVIAGRTWSFGAGAPESSNGYLIRTDAKGDTLWTRTYGGPDYASFESVQQTTDGGYIMTGLLKGFVYLVKTDAKGDTLWTRRYHAGVGAEGYSVEQTTGGGYIIAGVVFLTTYSDIYLIKTNASGDTLWTKRFGGSRGEWGYSVEQTADGGYIVAGYTSTLGDPAYTDVYLIKTNAEGDTAWTRTYGRTDLDEGNSVRQTADGGYVVVGRTFSSRNRMLGDVYLIRTNAQGDTVWTRTYGGMHVDEGYSVIQTTDGAYSVTGRSWSFGAGQGDAWLIKVDGVLDAGPIAVQSPPGVVDSGISYVPRTVVRNFGLTSGSIVQVTMNIGSGYTQTVQETLVSVPLDTVVFPAWTAEPVGWVAVRCFTSLLGDEDPANDTIGDSVRVVPPPWHDVGAVAIVSPSGNVRAGDTVIPRARIRNFGNRQERYFDVRFRIGASYNEKVDVADALPAGSVAELAFPPWVAEASNWVVSCSTMLGSDEDSANDKVSSSLLVVPQSLSIAPDQSDRIEAGKSKTYQFHAVITGDTGGIVEVERPTSPPRWSVRLCDATGANDLTDTDGDGTPDLGYVAPGDSGWFSLDVTASSGTQGDTASLGQGVFLVAGHVSDRPDIADTATLTLTLVPEFSVHNFPNPFTNHTSFVLGLPEDGKVSLTVYTRAGERVCRVLANADLPAGVHLVRWDGVNDNGRTIAPGTYEYLLDYVHGGKTDRIRKRLVLTRQ